MKYATLGGRPLTEMPARGMVVEYECHVCKAPLMSVRREQSGSWLACAQPGCKGMAELHIATPVNLNDYILFAPNAKGLQVWEGYHAFFNVKAPPLKLNTGGYARMQFHEFLAIFGPAVAPDVAGSPCDTEVYFESAP